jgi:hypothetical protein
MRQRSIEAEKFWRDTFSDNKAILTSDGREIFFTTAGRKEFFSSMHGAFFGGHPNAASSEFRRSGQLANELLGTVDKLGELVSKAKLVNKESNRKPDKKPLVDHYEIFMVPVTINGKVRKMKIKTEMRKIPGERLKRNYYFHYLQEQQIAYATQIVSFEFID